MQTEVWNYVTPYGVITFGFFDPYLTGEFKLASGRPSRAKRDLRRVKSPFRKDYAFEYFEISRKIPEIYEFDYGGELFAFPCDFADFRGEDGRSRLEVYYGFPIQKLSDTATVQTGVFVFDDRWQKVVEVKEEEALRVSGSGEGELIADTERLNLLLGEYHLVVEARNKRTKNTGRYKKEITVEGYGRDSLAISDIQLAASISPSVEETKFTKNGLRVVPFPTRRYRQAQLVYTYYEIYNLSRDSCGRTHGSSGRAG